MMHNKHSAKSREAEKAFKAKQAAAAKALGAARETGETVLKSGADAATKAYGQAGAATFEQMQKAFPQAAGTFDAMTGFQKANLEALAASGMAAMKGIETLSGELLAFNRKSIEDSVANVKRLFDCKTVQELGVVQADLARANFEQMIAQGTRITDLAVKVATEISAPLQGRVGEAAGKLGKPFAV